MHFLSLHLYLIIISSLFITIKCEKLISKSFDSSLNPDIISKNCTFGDICIGSINSTVTHYYSVQYTYTPNMTIRVNTNMTYNESQNAPILVVVRQYRDIVSWTLPYTFSNGMIYSYVSRILCPHNEKDRNHIHTSTVFLEVSTSNIELIDYSIEFHNVTDYILEYKQDLSFTASPSMPIYYRVYFPIDVENVFITVESKDKLCAVVSVQSYDCPAYDISELGLGQGHYQTMSEMASMNVYSSEFTKKNSFLLVFFVKPTDADCLNYKTSAEINPSGIVDIERTKTATVKLYSSLHINYLIITIILTLVIFALIYIITFIIMCKYSDIYENFGPDNFPLVESQMERELEEQIHNNLHTTTDEGEDNVMGTRPFEFLSQVSTVEVIEPSNRGFVTVNDLCVKNYEVLKQKFRIYPTTMVTIAIFYSLPVIQLVLQYQVNIDSIGNEDLCYFNFLCTRELFHLSAFNNIFSNIGYSALGILFFIIVYRDKYYTQFILKYPAIAKEFGIPQHFSLFYAMAIGLIMEGVMSACYHVCPSRQNFQFDTSFMFIMAVLNLIKIYQTRHADINPNSARTFSFLAIVIFITVIGVYFDKLWFWITYCILHIVLCVIFTAKIYYMGRLKITFRVHVHLYRLIKENGCCSRPRYINRMIPLLAANSLNMAFALYGAIFQPESFPNHLLFVFLGNLVLYLTYYILMKFIHRETVTRFSKFSLLLSMCFWIPSLVFFFDEVKSYEVQPAISRTYNQHCLILDTYDAHDIWHLLSSFGLFFSFLSMLTIDDGVRFKQRKELAAF